jgi:uncharacterized repeat protein (TIGR03803 family)
MVAALAALLNLSITPAAGAGPAPAFTVVHTFTGTDGSRPLANLLLYKGTVYGATSGGGARNAGAIFRIVVNSGAETVLHSFAGGPSDGANPLSGLMLDSIGNLYGTTFGGGTQNAGTMFEINFEGGFELLHSFTGAPSQGADPAGTLVQDYAGNIYGTTYAGARTQGLGTTFEWTAAGIYFTGETFATGWGPARAGLLLTGGHLYGTTCGSGNPPYGGTVFEVGVKTPLYTFSGGADGAQPMASLISDGSGNLYGTAMAGGKGSFGTGSGVVFEINASTGAEKVLHSFAGPDGAGPTGSLARDKAGNLYGTTMWGGTLGFGTVFELTTSGSLVTLHNFTGKADGANPFAGVTLDSSGNLWGAASVGGSATAPGGNGVIFMIALESAS